MIALYGSVDLARHGRIAVVTVDNPPANALSHVRKGLKDDRVTGGLERIDAETKAPKRDFRSPFHPVTMRGGAMTKEP
jgi:hypothetical protein